MRRSRRGKTTARRDAARWDLSPLFSGEEAILEARREVEERLRSLGRWRGVLMRSASTLGAALDEFAEIAKVLRRVHAYASMRADEDVRVAARHALREETELLFHEMARRTAYVTPEILAAPRGRVPAFLRSEPRLSPHAHALRTVLRMRKHVLGLKEERILAEAGILAGGSGAVFSLLHNAEMPRTTVRLRSGRRVRLGPSEYALHRASPARQDRERVVSRYLGGYRALEATFGQNLFECVKQHVFHARARHYPSCLSAALDPNAIPEGVYRNLLEQCGKMLPLLHRYFRLRARALGLERLAYHDLHCPIVPCPAADFGPREARSAVLRALAPLGARYVAALDRAFRDRWIDWLPSPGKRAGAYANGVAYDVHPYVLLNFNGDFESVSTLAHELGHAMHSHFSNRAQPFPAAEYPIFLAEVASTFNEILLHHDLFGRARRREERLYLTARWLDDLRATFFRQAMFAEFELAIHEKVERGEALTGRGLTAEYLELLRRHCGHDGGVVRVNETCGVEWAAIPHFHYGFYVYQYATGIAASVCLAEAVLAERPGARTRYLELLSAGGSDDPLALLHRAGVDLAGGGPYEAVARTLAAQLDRLEELLEEGGGRPRRAGAASGAGAAQRSSRRTERARQRLIAAASSNRRGRVRS